MTTDVRIQSSSEVGPGAVPGGVQPKQRIAFELDPQIIHHIIYSQAGSMGKAIIELIMNSVDASATEVQLTLTKEGFTCSDDGNGFATRHDVLRYFGRFGTPHEEGDATFGRFRLGRGQIMAHARTVWDSNSWRMEVDTRTMGYGYDLADLAVKVPGCTINGIWYEQLTHSELMSAVQEIRDLVRYTPVRVNLNGNQITRDPRNEKWDFQDEYAYYRAKAEGSVSIYNQGVLVRHDSSQLWGAGGLIVSKVAIALNVSRTEILRSTCPVWKPISKQFGILADGVSARLGDHRKTEARREKFARALLSADPSIISIYRSEEVITLLPGNKHVSMSRFMDLLHYSRGGYQKNQFAVVEDSFDVPKGESIARQGIAVIVHPKTLTRFGCYSAQDLCDSIARIHEHIKTAPDEPNSGKKWLVEKLRNPVLIAFKTLKEAFIERSAAISEKKFLDKETRRAWTALRACLAAYVSLCTGGDPLRHGRRVYGGKRMEILLGQSNHAEAWTDGATYIAIDIKNVVRLKSEPLMAAARIFGIVDHEICHEGDSLDCGHDDAFHERYHDLSIKMAAERQRFLHVWLQKYTYSMEQEGQHKLRGAWYERALVDRAGSGRQKRGLPGVIDGVDGHALVSAPVPAENMALIDTVNAKLIEAGLCPPPPDWAEIFERARAAQAERAELLRKHEEAEREMREEHEQARREYTHQLRTHFSVVLSIPPEELSDSDVRSLDHFAESPDDEDIRAAWKAKVWEQDPFDHDYDAYESAFPSEQDPQPEKADEKVEDPAAEIARRLPADVIALVKEGETMWALERNAAAAGFSWVPDYLNWRAQEAQ